MESSEVERDVPLQVATAAEVPASSDQDAKPVVQTFTMMDDADTESEEDEDKGDDDEEDEAICSEDGFPMKSSENFSHRLSFMFEHNNLINMRMASLASDIRNGRLLTDDTDDDGQDAQAKRKGFQPPPRQQRSRKSILVDADSVTGLSAQLKSSVTDGRANDLAELDALRSANAELRKRIAELEGSKRVDEARCNDMGKFSEDAPAAADMAELQTANGLPTMASSAPSRKPRQASQDMAVGDESAKLGHQSVPLAGPSCASESTDYSAQAENRRRRKEIAGLHAKVLQERTRRELADKESAGLRRDLKKCKNVIERLVRELDVATRELAASSSAPGAPAGGAAAAVAAAVAPAKSTVGESQVRAKQPLQDPGRGDAEPSRGSVVQAKSSAAAGKPLKSVLKKGTSVPTSSARPSYKPPSSAATDSFDANRPSVMSDLSSAIGTFFGNMGVGSRPTEDAIDEQDEKGLDDTEDQFCWCQTPMSKNIKVADNGQTASYTAQDKDALHAFVATAEPPLLEANLGYGFEVLVQGVRSGSKDGMAIGFTATPPEDWPKELPESADLIESTWLVGYNGEMYDGGTERWAPCSWCPVDLAVGDRVGAQVSFDGKLHIVVNHNIVWSAHIPISRSSPPLYGIVDLLGNTDEVMLLE